MAQTILVDISDNVALVTLNRPDVMNALSVTMRKELSRVIQELDNDPQARAIILTGAGERAFSAGVDLKELSESTDILQSSDASTAPDEAALMIAACRTPIIAAVNGVAVTGGFELALSCDFMIASRNARFADTHARVGLVPSWGLSQRLSRLIGIGRAKELSLTGNFISADQACEWGLVNHVVDLDELLPLARKLASDMVGIDPDFLATYKALINDGYATTFAQGLDIEQDISSVQNASVSADDVERRRADVQSRGRKQ